MSIPIKHHFLPKFYLDRWALKERPGRVCVYSKPHNKVVVADKGIKHSGYVERLYSIKSRSNPNLQQEIESSYLSDLDFVASKALDKMELTGEKPRDAELARGWSRFILSQLSRSPDRIAWLEEKLREKGLVTLFDIEDAYNTFRTPQDEPFISWIRKAGSDLNEEAKMLILKNFIDGDLNMTRISHMRWRLYELRRTAKTLLTSDNPVLTSNGISHTDSFIIMPTGPNRVFIAANGRRGINAFMHQDPEKFVHALNDAIARQADRLVVGSVPSHLEFVGERLLAGPNEKQGYLDRMIWGLPSRPHLF